MTFDAIRPFLEEYLVWNDEKDLDWYELMWKSIIASGLIDNLSQKDRLKPYLYASTLVDFYRSYISEMASESWNEENLTSENIPEYSYMLMCETVGISQITFKNLIEKEGDEVLDLPVKDLEKIIIESTPDYSEMYYEYAFPNYSRELFSVLKRDFSVSEMFNLMTYTFYHERFSSHHNRFETNQHHNEDNLSKSEQFRYAANNSAELFYQDIDLTRGLEWICAVYS